MIKAFIAQRVTMALLATFLSCSCLANRTPMYQLYSQPWNDYFYTVDPNQRATAMNPPYNCRHAGMPGHRHDVAE